MKNVVYIGRYLGIVGGIERYMLRSAQLLRNQGVRVSYLHSGEMARDELRFAAAFDAVSRFTDGAELLRRAELVVLHTILPVEQLKRLPRGRSFFFAHDHNIYCRRHHYYTPFGRRNCHRASEPLRCFFCSLGRGATPPLAAYRELPALVLSEFMRENLLRNGFRQVIKLPAFSRPVQKEHKFMKNRSLRILSMGQLIRGKGVDLLIDLLRKVDVPLDCTIAGDGRDRAMLERRVHQYRLEERVRFIGWQNDPERCWEACDLFFFPIRWQEPFGLVGLEALAHGVPVIAFDRGGVREWLRDTVNGYALSPGDAGRAAEILSALQRDPEQLARLGKNALETVKNEFSEQGFLEKFAALAEGWK